MDEEQNFETELNKLEPQQRELIMDIVTSRMEKGMEKGLKQGKREMIVRQLHKRLGAVESDLETRVDNLSAEQLDQLTEAVLEFGSPADLVAWLEANAPHKPVVSHPAYTCLAR